MNWTDLASLMTILLGTVGINIYLFKSHEKKIDTSMDAFGEKMDEFSHRMEAMEKRQNSESKRIDAVYETLLHYLNK